MSLTEWNTGADTVVSAAGESSRLRKTHCVDGEVGSGRNAVIERLATGRSGPAPSLVGDNGSGL